MKKVLGLGLLCVLVGCSAPTGSGEPVIERYESGQKKKEGTYKSGKREGVWTYWDDKGNVTKTETYKNGELVK